MKIKLVANGLKTTTVQNETVIETPDHVAEPQMEVDYNLLKVGYEFLAASLVVENEEGLFGRFKVRMSLNKQGRPVVEVTTDGGSKSKKIVGTWQL